MSAFNRNSIFDLKYGYIMRELGNLTMKLATTHGRDAAFKALQEYGATNVHGIPLGNVRGFREHVVALLEKPATPEYQAEEYSKKNGTYQARTIGDVAREGFLAGYNAAKEQKA